MRMCQRREWAAFVVSFILSDRRLRVRLVHQQAATAQREAVSLYHGGGHDDPSRKAKDGEREGTTGAGRVCGYEATLIEPIPRDVNAGCNLTLTQKRNGVLTLSALQTQR